MVRQAPQQGEVYLQVVSMSDCTLALHGHICVLCIFQDQLMEIQQTNSRFPVPVRAKKGQASHKGMPCEVSSQHMNQGQRANASTVVRALELISSNGYSRVGAGHEHWTVSPSFETQALAHGTVLAATDSACSRPLDSRASPRQSVLASRMQCVLTHELKGCLRNLGPEAAMAPAKRKRAQQPVEEHDSDSDAPEEFSNAASKQQAIDSARAARAASRQSRQGKKAASAAAAEDGDGKPGGQEENLKGTDLTRESDEADQEDLLPLDVIQQLAEKHRSAATLKLKSTH